MILEPILLTSFLATIVFSVKCILVRPICCALLNLIDLDYRYYTKIHYATTLLLTTMPDGEAGCSGSSSSSTVLESGVQSISQRLLELDLERDRGSYN